MKNNIKIAAMVLALIMAVTGCNVATGNSSEDQADTSASAVTLSAEEIYSDRDMENTYEEDDAEYITLEGEDITITQEGTYVISGTLEDGQIIIEAGDEDKIQLVLDGVDITSSSSAAIYIKSADKVFITLAEGSENYLANTTGFEADGDTNVDAVIFSKADLTLNGEGSLTIESADHGITSKDDLVITDGTYDITAASHALQGKDLIAIAGGDFTLTATEDAIHAKNSDDTTLGDIEIDGGTFTITAGDDAIHAESDLVVNGGTIDILSCNEGLEGNTVTVTGGDITINASDDAVNAAGASATDEFANDTSAQIYIYGGTIDITCNGDAIDSNGSITMTGGYVTISGPDMSGNGTMDYNGTASITGGTIIAASIAGMAMNFSEASQGSILVSTEQMSAGTEITVTDEDGNEIISYTPDLSYSCVLVSSPEIEKGSTYTITAGSTFTEVTVEDYITGAGQGMGMMGQMGQMGQMPGGDMSGEMPSGEMPNGERPSDMSGQMPGGMGGQMPGGQNSEN